MSFVIWKNGKPYAASDPKEAQRLSKRMQMINKILKNMGYPDGAERYDEIMQDLGSNHFDKYLEFLKKIEEAETP